MKLKDLVRQFDLEVKTGSDSLDRDVRGGYASDLLSDVLAHAEEANVWVTLHVHENIVAVASHKGLSGIILVQGRQPDAETMARAEKEEIPLMVSKLPAFELIGRLYREGIRGM